ncbi:glutaredoxin-related protein 5, mitochondrial [Phlebotomus argentipes]|uniref:glutaredoxin-related protein 5, mitochondrial n=1 Tax=Phlebotomus argentipes TaxID=94469 RepID=UPI00289320DE|nr:glutaredoxin-related protein 5, mitochondrial [Phlebotomus argentipes]
MNILGRIARPGSFPVKYLANYSQFYCTAPPVSQQIDKMVRKSKVVVFMKGNPEAPRCGFSNAVVQVMRMHAVPYDSYDVLSDESLRQGIKDFSNWPTIPQVFIDGEFVGGCDIMLQMHQNGELIEELKKVGIRSALLDAQPETDDTKK